MFKKLILVSVLCLSMAACSSAKKKDGAADGAVGSEDLSFDARGSDSGAIQGLSTITFGYDSSTLSSEAKTTLKENSEWLKSRSNLNLQIEGHCDVRGSVEYNLSLGERRARTVKAFLEGLGLAGDRLSVISYGKEKLLNEGDSESAHSANRRANFVPISR